MRVHSGNTTDRGMKWHRRGSSGSKVVQSLSMVIFKTQLDEPLSCLVCFQGPLKLSSNPGHTTALLLSHFIHSSCYDVFKENLCVVTMKSVVGVEEQHWFTQCRGWDGELFGMKCQGVWETGSVQRLGFQKNAIVLCCHFFLRMALNETTYTSVRMMTKSNCGAKPLPDKGDRFKIPLCSYE